MHISTTVKFSIGLTLLTVFSAVLAAAQQYEIVRADYGYGNQRVDVTQRLREVVSTHSTFRMGNSTFGVDPSPGNKKSLRIFARGPQGETQTFEYRESSTIDSSMFSGASGGNWGGGFSDGGGDAYAYAILHAEYGTERNHVDVTQRLRELARADRSFRMGNSTFGVDPDPDHIKMLRIYARGPDGQERMFEYRESSTIDGSQFTGWGEGNWGDEGWNGGWGGSGVQGNSDSGAYTILHAEYGTEQNHVDVTNRLRELARADLTFRMGNSTFGVDPAPGFIKTLRIYTRGPDGQERMFEYRESSTVDGSQFRAWGRGDWGNEGWNGGWTGGGFRDHGGDRGDDAGEYVIVRAEYGTERNRVDVTDRLRELARSDRRFRMGNSTFGVDPDPNHIKTLRIYARGLDGQERMFEYRESGTVDGAQFKGWGGGEWGGR
jgi:hypothetical protein